MHMMLSSVFVTFLASNFVLRLKKGVPQGLQLVHLGAVQSRLDYIHTSGGTIVQEIKEAYEIQEIGSARCVNFPGWFSVTIQCAS